MVALINLVAAGLSIFSSASAAPLGTHDEHSLATAGIPKNWRDFNIKVLRFTNAKCTDAGARLPRTIGKLTPVMQNECMTWQEPTPYQGFTWEWAWMTPDNMERFGSCNLTHYAARDCKGDPIRVNERLNVKKKQNVCYGADEGESWGRSLMATCAQKEVDVNALD